MKKLVITSILALMIATGTTLKAQDNQDNYLGLPGDNLNLYAVMNLFQNSKTLEEFERRLNDQNSRINNLDLNGDNIVDYISVADHMNRGVHNIVLSVALNSFEKQDVAVFTVEPFRNGTAQIQLIGDESLYGRNYIIEPIYADNDNGTLNPGYNGDSGYSNNANTTTYVEISAWPVMSYLFRPDYVVWHSSWYWDYYPDYWHSWSPFSWNYYYGYQSSWYPDYYRHYRHWDRPRYAHYNDFYYRDIRSHSRMVSDRIRGGNYRSTYSHPEQRRDGEALYNRMHSDRNSSLSGNYTNRNRGSRSVASQNNNRSSDSRSYSNSRRSNNINSNSLRSNNSYTGNTRSNYSQGQNARISNRSAVTVPERSTSNTRQYQNTSVSRRSAISAPDRTASNRSFSQNARTSQRSSAPSSGRLASRREIRGETASATRRSNISSGSQNRRMDREVKSSGSARSNDRNKGSDNSGTSRRR